MTIEHIESPRISRSTVIPESKKGNLGRRLADTIGNTPLLRLESLADLTSAGVEIYAKAEWFNPGGSVKDRPALNMIRMAEQSRELTSEKILLDASSGNTAVAYAMIGASRGYGVLLCVPENVSDRLRKTLKAYGADLILTDAARSSDGAIEKAREIHSQDPDRYYYIDQYNNDNNWKAHYRTTGLEIWNQTNGEVTHFIAGVGTSGTLRGTGTRLKELNPEITLISVQPNSPLHGLEGLKHMKTAIVPGIYTPSLADMDLSVSTEQAQEMVKRLAREEGVFVGLSSGAALAASIEVGQSLDQGVIVTLFPDGGQRYVDEQFWEES